MVGSSNTDLVARVPYYPKPGECLTGTTFSIGFGGKGANQAVMAALLGAHVTVVTKLGRDQFGTAYLDNYRSHGIDTSHVVFDDRMPSGVSLIWVEESTGLNTIAYVPGANGRLGPEDIVRAADAIGEADVLMCQLEVPLAATLEAVRIARSAPRPPLILLNAAPVPQFPLPDELLESVDLLIVNEEETAHLASSTVGNLDEALAAATKLASRWSSAIIVTLGRRGAVLAVPNALARHIPALQARAVDTTGAGDVFVGSLACMLAAGVDLGQAVERAVGIATRSVLRAGAQSSFPSRDEVARLLAP